MTNSSGKGSYPVNVAQEMVCVQLVRTEKRKALDHKLDSEGTNFMADIRVNARRVCRVIETNQESCMSDVGVSLLRNHIWAK